MARVSQRMRLAHRERVSRRRRLPRRRNNLAMPAPPGDPRRTGGLPLQLAAVVPQVREEELDGPPLGASVDVGLHAFQFLVAGQLPPLAQAFGDPILAVLLVLLAPVVEGAVRAVR